MQQVAPGYRFSFAWVGVRRGIAPIRSTGRMYWAASMKMSPARLARRLALLCSALALVCIGIPTLGSPASATPNAALTRYPYLTDSIQSSITVNWATDTSFATGSLQWGPPGNCTANVATASKIAITVNSKPEYQWQATISVSPDTAYCYRSS